MVGHTGVRCVNARLVMIRAVWHKLLSLNIPTEKKSELTAVDWSANNSRIFRKTDIQYLENPWIKRRRLTELPHVH